MLVSSKRSSGHKTNYCYYCGLLWFKPPRYLENSLGQDIEVAWSLPIPKKSKERQNESPELACKSDYKVNIENIRNNREKISVSQRSGKMSSIKDFVPCVYCKSFFHAKSLCKHTKVCFVRLKENDENKDQKKFMEYLPRWKETTST